MIDSIKEVESSCSVTRPSELQTCVWVTASVKRVSPGNELSSRLRIEQRFSHSVGGRLKLTFFKAYYIKPSTTANLNSYH